MSYQDFQPLIFKFINPEIAHNIAISALKYKFLPWNTFTHHSHTYKNKIFNLPHPVGIAAGFDKNAECIEALFNIGFSFIEVGTVTPKPQIGNPKPRIFRLPHDKAIINCLGFNNKGLDYFCSNLYQYRQNNTQHGIIGANIGKNKDQDNPIIDYLTCLTAVYDLADYITINISSPNTQGLRNLQESHQLTALLEALHSKRLQFTKQKPIFIKIAPDITLQQLDAIYQAVLNCKIDGIVLTNTTTQRPTQIKDIKVVKQFDLHNKGGLSGPHLKHISNHLLKHLNNIRNPNDNIKIISVGGIDSTHEVVTRLNNGANAVQIYTSFIYLGIQKTREMIKNIA